MAEKDIIVNLKVNTGNSTQSVDELAKSEKDLAINTEAANVALKQSTAVTTQNANATEQAADANVSLRKQLRALQEQLGKLAVAGKQNTDEYRKLKNEAGQLKDAISDVSQEIAQAGSDTRGLDQTIRVASVAAAGFSILEGATALFGKENEDLQKSLLKVTAAVSVLNGLQEIQAELTRKDSLFTKGAAAAKLIYAAAVGTSTGAMKLFRLALLATGIGAFIVLIGLLIANFDKIKAAVSKFLPGLDQLQKGFDTVKVAIAGFAEASLTVLTKVIKTLFIVPRTLFALFNDGLGAAIDIVKETGSELFNLFGDASKAYQKGAANQKALNAENEKTRQIQAQILALNKEIQRVDANLGDTRALQLKRARLELGLLENGTDTYFEKLKEVNGLQKELNETNKVATKTNKELADQYKANIAGIAAESTEFRTVVTDFNQSTEEQYKAQIEALDQLIVKIPQAGRAIQQAQKILNDLLQSIREPEVAAEPLEIKLENPEDLKKRVQDLLNAKFKAEQEQAEKDKVAAAQRREQEKQAAIQSALFAQSQIRDITQKAFAFRQQTLDNQLKQGLISEEKYAEETKKLKIKEAKAAKAFAIFDATINIASAIVNALKAGPAAPFLVALIAALGAAQIALIAATPIPKFFKGVIDLKRGVFPKGRDTIPAMLHEGESVMTQGETKEHKDLFTHIRNKTFHSVYMPKMAYKYLNIPAINSKALSNIRLTGNGNRSDKAIEEELRMLRLMLREGNRINKRTADNTGELKKPRRRAFNV